MSDSSIKVNEPTSATTDVEIDAEQISASGPQESKPLRRERVQIGGDALAKVAAVGNADPASDAYALTVRLPAGTTNIGDVDVLSIAAGDNNIGNVDIASIAAGNNNIGNVDLAEYTAHTSDPATNAAALPVRPAGPLPAVSVSGTLSDINSTVSLTLQGRRFVSVQFDDQSGFDGKIGAKATGPEGEELRVISDGNRWPRDGLAVFPNGLGAGEPAVTFGVMLNPSDTSVTIYVQTYNSGTVDCTIVASDRPNALVAYGAGAAVFWDGGNPVDSDSCPPIGLAVGGDDSKSVAGKHIGRIVEVLPDQPEGDEVGFVVRPIDRNSTANGTLDAVGEAVTISMHGMAGCSFDVDVSDLSGTIVAEVLIGNTWRNALIVPGNTLTIAATGIVNPTAGSTYTIVLSAGAQQARVRCSARASGSVTIYLTGTKIMSPLAMMLNLALAGTTSPLVFQAISGVDVAGVARALPIREDSAATYALATREARTLAWSKYHTPAVNTKATIASSAAGSGKRNICRSITLTLVGSTTAPTAGTVTAGLYDGTSSGTVLWQIRLGIPNVAGAMNGVTVPGFWKGTANTAMTLRFNSTGYANAFQSVAMTGDVVTEA